ncbi:MAG: hypothetical protein QM704_21585 [Anaeromyxobacteraceae bacterium]
MTAALPLDPFREILDRLAVIEERIRRIESHTAANEPMVQHRLLSLRAAAERLGVSRTRTLPLLIQDGRLRVVHVAGRPKVPLAEVERVEREGTVAFRKTARSSRTPTRSGAPLARDLV